MCLLVSACMLAAKSQNIRHAKSTKKVEIALRTTVISKSQEATYQRENILK